MHRQMIGSDARKMIGMSEGNPEGMEGILTKK